MATYKKKRNFLETDEGLRVHKELEIMDSDSGFHTEPSYIADAANYPNNLIPFVDKHMKYLNNHQNVDPDHYLANLRLVTRLK